MATSTPWLLLLPGLFVIGLLTPGTAGFYGYGTGVDSEKMTISGDDPKCIDFPSVRIMESPGAYYGTSGKLCISPNGGVSFSETAFQSGTFAPMPSSSSSQEAAILPLYIDYDPFVNFNDDAATTGIFYTVMTDSADLQSYVTDIDTCGLVVNGFEPFWGVRITWANLWPSGNTQLFSSPPTATNTFQIVLLGNAGDALFVIINYDKISFTSDATNSAQTLIQGNADPTKVHALAPSTSGGNCAGTSGRFVFYVSNDIILEPGDNYPCADGTDCGTYFAFHTGTAGAASGSCSGTECVCNSGYTGIYCLNDDTNNCDPDPCDAAHSLLCEDTGLGADVDATDRYMCHCDVGYEGDLCADEILACDSNPCTNGGTCVDIPLDFQCTCPPTWTGTTCETDVDECATANPCQNGGTCQNSPGSYSCDCTGDFSGVHCECSAWSAWSTKCQTADGWDGLCGGCGQQHRTRTCSVGSTDSLTSTRPCNVRSCTRSVYKERTQTKYRRNDDGSVVSVIRPRRCCYKFPSGGSPRKLGREKQCQYILNGFI